MTQPVRQIAYFVADVRKAAMAHHQIYGSGPFLVLDHIELSRSEHRGVSRPLDHSSAYGQWGTIMVEFVQQHNEDPSAYHDLYPRGTNRFGLHHLAIFVDDLEEAIAGYESAGAALAQDACTTNGTRFAFVDTSATLGHMIELYEPAASLTGFYDHVSAAAHGWDGTDPVRTLNSR